LLRCQAARPTLYLDRGEPAPVPHGTRSTLLATLRPTMAVRVTATESLLGAGSWLFVDRLPVLLLGFSLPLLKGLEGLFHVSLDKRFHVGKALVGFDVSPALLLIRANLPRLVFDISIELRALVRRQLAGGRVLRGEQHKRKRNDDLHASAAALLPRRPRRDRHDCVPLEYQENNSA